MELIIHSPFHSRKRVITRGWGFSSKLEKNMMIKVGHLGQGALLKVTQHQQSS